MVDRSTALLEAGQPGILEHHGSPVEVQFQRNAGMEQSTASDRAESHPFDLVSGDVSLKRQKRRPTDDLAAHTENPPGFSEFFEILRKWRSGRRVLDLGVCR